MRYERPRVYTFRRAVSGSQCINGTEAYLNGECTGGPGPGGANCEPLGNAAYDWCAQGNAAYMDCSTGSSEGEACEMGDDPQKS